ncbi:hypothetical protein HDU67_005572 [Dinochytrium kinnereticum]|nr:hypothetical protein HDU67_005572 [Dinochytrium kinnereticum]
MSNEFTVAIVGGGLVGSLAAVYFAQRGWKVTLYELRGDIRKVKHASGRSINLALSVRGLSALNAADAGAKIVPSLIPMKGRMIHVNGKLSSQPYGVFGECINSVDRKLVNESLLDIVETYPNVNVVFGHELKSVDFHKKTLVFSSEDGKVVTTTVDLILGCDGAYSKVRQSLMKTTRMDFSQEYIEHGYVELNMPPGADGDYQMDPNHLHIWPRQTFMLIALPNVDKSFTVTLFMPWSKFDSIKNENDLLSFFDETFPDAVQLIGRGLLASDYFKNPKGALVSVKCKPYNYKGSAVIIGDAAHAMVPFYGQGMNCGFEDCLVLDEILTKHVGERGSEKSKHPDPADIEAALTEYSRTRHRDAAAMCDLAMYNYVEMRSSVTKTGYLIRKKVESFLHRYFPKSVIPLYTMVSFSRIPYADALERFNRQTQWFNLAGSVGIWSSALAVAGVGAWAALHFFGVMSLKKLITKHFGGIPTSVKDLEWLIRIRPDLAPTIVSAGEYREVAPGSQPDAHLIKNPPISKNHYYNRDNRRSYPATVMYSTQEINQFVLTAGSQPRLAAGEITAVDAPKVGSATTTATETGDFFPPIIDNKYRWRESMPHLKPDEINPQMCILRHASQTFHVPELCRRLSTGAAAHSDEVQPSTKTHDAYSSRIRDPAPDSSPPRKANDSRRRARSGGDAIADQLELLYAKQAAALIQEGDARFNQKLKESKEFLQNFITSEESRVDSVYRTAIIKDKRKKYAELDEAKTAALHKIKTRLEKFQKSAGSLHEELDKINASIAKGCRAFDASVVQMRSTYKRDSSSLVAGMIKEVNDMRKSVKNMEKPDADYNKLKAVKSQVTG